MNAHISIGALIAAACSSMTLAGDVVDLDPGEIVEGLSGITNSMMSELIGSIEFDAYQDFSIGITEGSDANPIYEASLMTRVVRSNQTGNLTFNFRIFDANADLSGQVSHVDITGFNGLQTRVEYRGEVQGPGDDGPSGASRSQDGNMVSFDFGTALETGESSKYFFAMLDVADYDFDSMSTTATIYLLSGESVTLDINSPIPAPGSLALLGVAGMCVTRRRR